MNSCEPIRPRDRLLAVARLWSAATGRTEGALSSVVTNNGGTLDRLRDPANAVTDATLERFARFLAEPANWPGAEVPEEALHFAHVTGIPAVATREAADSGEAGAVATGENGEMSGRAAA